MKDKEIIIQKATTQMPALLNLQYPNSFLHFQERWRDEDIEHFPKM